MTDSMKTCLGIIGGIGPESTVDYYKRLVRAFHGVKELRGTEILIHSLDLDDMLALVAARDWDALTEVLVSRLTGLRQAGAGLGLIASNTPHVVFERVAARSPMPLVSIVEATVAEARARGFRRLGLLGTAFTMQNGFYVQAFAEAGMELSTPCADDQRYIHDKLMTEIEHGVFKDDTRQGLLRIIERLRADDDIQAAVLGCTELPLILEDGQASVPLLNTTALHVEYAVERLRSQA